MANVRIIFLPLRLRQDRFPEKFPHSRKVFSRLLSRIRIDGIVQPHHNKGRIIIRRRIRNVRSTNIIGSTLVAPHDSVRRRAKNSDIPKSTVHLIFRDHKFHPYRAQLHQVLNRNDYQI